MLYQLSYGTLCWSGVFRCFAVQSYNLFHYCANIFRIIFCRKVFVGCLSVACRLLAALFFVRNHKSE